MRIFDMCLRPQQKRDELNAFLFERKSNCTKDLDDLQIHHIFDFVLFSSFDFCCVFLSAYDLETKYRHYS